MKLLMKLFESNEKYLKQDPYIIQIGWSGLIRLQVSLREDYEKIGHKADVDEATQISRSVVAKASADSPIVYVISTARKTYSARDT